MRRFPPILLSLAGLAAAAALPAQESGGVVVPASVVERVGSSDISLDRRLARLLEAEPTVLAGDTTIGKGDTIAGPVLVVDATLVLEGVVTGDLVLVDAGAFVRPDAHVQGDLVNIAGGLYRSEQSRVDGAILDLPTADYRIVRTAETIRIEATGSPARLELDGMMGLRIPTYDRVNGITLEAGAGYRLPRIGPVTPRLHGYAGWTTERGEPVYGVSAALRWGGTTLSAGYDDHWSTNDDWIAGDLLNSLNYLWDGDDFRDYNAVERAWVRLDRAFGDPEKRYSGLLALEGRVEDASSLPGGDPWHLWGESARPNPAIDPGRTTSLLTSYELVWRGLETWFDGRVEYEAARDWLDSDFDFDRVAVVGDWAMHALADHTLEVEFFLQHPIGDGVLPRQNWSFVGGSRTLQTVEFARYSGGRVVFVETTYMIPMPDRVAVPLLGPPDLQLIHGVGMAWTDAQDPPPFEQEIGARLLFFGLDFRYMIDPTDPSEGDLDIGINVPFGKRYPWERR